MVQVCMVMVLDMVYIADTDFTQYAEKITIHLTADMNAPATFQVNGIIVLAVDPEDLPLQEEIHIRLVQHQEQEAELPVLPQQPSIREEHLLALIHNRL